MGRYTCQNRQQRPCFTNHCKAYLALHFLTYSSKSAVTEVIGKRQAGKVSCWVLSGGLPDIYDHRETVKQCCSPGSWHKEDTERKL
jgi:hypothetical protein